MQPNSQKHWSRGQLESVPHCPACGCKKPASAVFTRRDNEGFMPDQWQMLLCSDCQSIWLNPRPDAESLPRAYDNYYTHHADADDIPPNNSSGLAWSLIYGYLNCRFGMHRRPANRLGYPLFSLIEPWRLKLDYYGRHLTGARSHSDSDSDTDTDAYSNPDSDANPQQIPPVRFAGRHLHAHCLSAGLAEPAEMPRWEGRKQEGC